MDRRKLKIEKGDRIAYLQHGSSQCAFQAGVLYAINPNTYSLDKVIGSSAACSNATFLAGNRAKDSFKFWNEMVTSQDPFIQLNRIYKRQPLISHKDMTSLNRQAFFPSDAPDIQKTNAQGKIPLYFGIFNEETKQTEYRKVVGDDGFKLTELATSIPYLSPKKIKNEEPYWDAGLSDRFCTQLLTACKEGTARGILILTKPYEQIYELPKSFKKLLNMNPLISNLLIGYHLDTSQINKAIEEVNDRHSDEVTLIKLLIKEEKLMVIEPDEPFPYKFHDYSSKAIKNMSTHGLKIGTRLKQVVKHFLEQ